MSVEASGIQPLLTVGEVRDPYEQEADRVAAQVMSMSVAPETSPQVQRLPEEQWFKAPSITPVVQRQVEPKVQMWQLLQRAGGGNEASGDLESRLNASKGGGSALAPEVRSFMEPRFGADFSAVRVHTGGEAVQMNRELGAQAFAHGSDVYFGAGKEPGNNELTAHELTHVVQQGGGFLAKHSTQLKECAEADLPNLQKKSNETLQNQPTNSSASQVLPEPLAMANAEPQSWIDSALTAIEAGQFQDALQAYDEGIRLNPDIPPSVDRGKLDILTRDREAPVQSENEKESASRLENPTEIAGDPGRFSNLPPWEPRSDSNSEKPNDEPQRLEAIRVVTTNAQFICEIAAEYNVTPDAIAGAILWEGIENPYSRLRVGPTRTNIPGKIHPYPGDVAEAVEQEGRVPPLNSRRPQIGPVGPRTERLRDPRWAIRYIGAILDRAAEFYEAEAKERGRKPYNIRDQAGILGALYQGGDAEGRAERFENRRDQDPRAVPRMDPDEKMGPWISQYRWWIQQLLQENGCDPKGFLPDGEMGPVPPLPIPIPNPFYPESGA